MTRRKEEKKGRQALEERLEKLGRKLEKVVRERAELMRELRPRDADDGAGVDAPTPWLSAAESGGAAATVYETIRNRRSVKRFTETPVLRETLQRLIEVAVLAPNHHVTEPWRFYILGPAARRAYGEALGARKARKLEDEDAGRQVREKVAREHEKLPAMIAVAMKLADDEERMREDFAATWMAVQNLCIAAAAEGLGTHIKTGAIMDDPAARAAVGVPSDQRIIAIVNLGEPEEVPSGKARSPASQFMIWRD